MLPVVAAVVGAGIVTSKVVEACRAHKSNLTMKAAQLPRPSDQEDDAVDPVMRDATGAYVRALTRPDGIELYVRSWPVQAGVQARALVIIAHGGGWHSGYHAPLAAHLSSQGCAVVAYDMRGHGLSGFVDGIPCYFNFKDHVGDLISVMRDATERHGGLPHFLFGESVGGSVVLSTLALKQDEAVVQQLSGYALQAPFIKLSAKLAPPPPVLAVVRVLSVFFPKMKLPDAKIDETFDQAFSDKETAAACRADPLVYDGVPKLRSMMSLLGTLRQIYDRAVALTTPVLIIHSKNDIRTQCSHSAEFLEASAATDKTLRAYDDGAHQLLQDTPEVRARVMADLTEWFLKRAPA